jgi:uncharacterized protein (DUF779 family)
VCRHHGRQAVVLSWPAGAAYLPAAMWVPGRFDVIVGHVACCPIYADVRQLKLFPDARLVLDLTDGAAVSSRPPLRLLPAKS